MSRTATVVRNVIYFPGSITKPCVSGMSQAGDETPYTLVAVLAMSQHDRQTDFNLHSLSPGCVNIV